MRAQSSDGKVDETAKTDEDGEFHLAVPPGSYELTTEAEGMMGGCEPEYVDVVAGKVAKVTVSCDTGIR